MMSYGLRFDLLQIQSAAGSYLILLANLNDDGF